MILSLLFPVKCVYCGEIIPKTKLPICKTCAKSIPLLKGDLCKYCGREYNACFCKLGDYAFTRNVSVLKYDGVAATIIKRFKFGKKPQLAKFMAEEVAYCVKKNYQDINFDFITFVPMNRIKQFKRGFNQSELIANEVGKILDLPVIKTLGRKYSSKDQKFKKRNERIKSVKGQFYARSQFDGKTILLIDDVLTSGATLSECSLMLKRSKALQVYTATFAITYKK